MNLKNNYSASEFQDNIYSCNICSESITNPLCPFCLAEEIKAWLTLYPHLKEELSSSLNDYLVNINNSITSYGVVCIKCHKDRASVCTYCFTEFVFRKLLEIKASQLILKEFFEFFNFDLEHKGYTEFAEEIGISE